MATALNGTIVDGGSQFAVSINSTDGTTIDPSRPTWLIIHGWNSNPDRFADMVSAIQAQRPTDQILVLDWQTAADTGALHVNPGEAETRIPLVASWAAAALSDAGFSGANLNEIGHDFGSSIAGEIAELIPGGVNTIVALDPYADIPGNSYNPEGPDGVNFAQYSQYSWAFHDSDPHTPGNIDGHGLASPSTPVTADEAYSVTGSYDFAIPGLFTSLAGAPSNIVGQYFNLQRLLDHQPVSWQLNQFNADGTQFTGAGYDAVIAATGGGVSPLSIAYVNAAASVSIDDVTVTESDSNTLITFTITRSGGTAEFYIRYASADGTATVADDDYSGFSGMLHFDANVNSMTVSFIVEGDLKIEPNEHFFVNIFDATNGAYISDSQGIGTIVSDEVSRAASDFNGDGNSDILWRNDAGTLQTWNMDGGNLLGATSLGTVPSAWKVAGTGDFNGDGKSDILWRNDSIGVAQIWDMDNANVAGTHSFVAIPAEWKILDTGDFNGDGTSDILWRNDSSGVAQIWDMDNGEILSAQSLGVIPAVWKFASTGDFNGDHKTDLLWRNDSSGVVQLWDMDNGNILSAQSLGVIPAAWKIAGTGDFDGDGKTDLLWRNDSGVTQLWNMDNGTIGITRSLGTIPSNWQIADVADFNGDSKADILWRNDSNGTTQIWEMNDGAITSAQSLGVVPDNWHILT
ncbi:FG-GAP repeat protein [Bradyrhizobium lablabi]|uniref:FG-GAP-like repeat-containing protein n=1 Tax=Bradyrhizobium lablabi TaxID=722472 RepID=UPI001BA88939|nr:FG-GAP-like repeat-containing protein [Bradyrhizobium lablabi]MBR1122682.1 FG-GAP repeat protein [Bradyrhizobium lablabi]